MESPVWCHLECDTRVAEIISRELSIDPVVARLLVQRGITHPAAAECFLSPNLEQLHDPFQLTDLHAGVDRLLEAVAQRESIVVHGDYDVDGITSTVMLRRALSLLGANVSHYIPERLRDGYGLQPEAINRLHANGANVVVTVDCGIRSRKAAERAKELGIDLIVTDHHEPGSKLPPAFAVINPRRNDCNYPEKHLAGVGVTFKLVQGLCIRAKRTKWIPNFLKLAAIGTLADVVPLRGENRVISKLGLDRLSTGGHTPGLKALLAVSGVANQRLGGEDIAFRVAPRINAAGRMSSPDIATQLLLATDDSSESEARELADRLNAENTKRRNAEATVVAEADRIFERDPTIVEKSGLVVWAEGWHRGVIGIVASKLVDRFGRPTIVLSINGNKAHGSGRSIPNFNLLAALEHCSDLLIQFGGHHQAAGLVVNTGRLAEFRRRFVEYVEQALEPQDLVPSLAVDGRLSLTSINDQLLRDLRLMEPFGSGNRRPIFFAAPVEVVDGPHMVQKQHLRMTVRQGRARFRAIAWRAATRASVFTDNQRGLNIAYSLAENTYRGIASVQLTVADVSEAR